MPNRYSPPLKSIAVLLVALSSLSSIAQWQYIRQLDKFTGEDESYVRLRSKNSQPVGINSQQTNVELIAFDSAKTDTFKSALLFSQHSMPVASSYKGNYCAGSYSCEVQMKIDDGELIKIPIIDSGKGDKAFVYMRMPNESVLKSLLQAKKIEMRAEFYNKGTGNFVFISDGKDALAK